MNWLKHLTFLLLFCCGFSASGSHLVGGEFRIKYVGNQLYDVQLNVFGDVAGLTTANQDAFVDVSVFSKATNLWMETFRMNLDSTGFVPYKNDLCHTGSIATKVLVYRVRHQFIAEYFDEPEGYYISWERCCRNIAIDNIVQPQNTGMVFYAEFPPLTVGGQPFINSTPILPPIPPEYLCVQSFYQFSMAATDPDGDSLAYALTVPLKGHTGPGQVYAAGSPAPYSPVTWTTGYSVPNMIQGTPALTINPRTGMLSVNPNQAGLFVFAFKVLEFRNGIKIGEVQRDVQVKINVCPTNVPPQVVLSPSPGNPGGYQEGDTLLVTDKTNFCYPITFTDPDIGQKVTVTVQPLNFSVKPIITPPSGTVIQSGQTFNGTICWADCNLNSSSQVYKVNLIVTDDACGAPAADTLQLTFLVVPTPNALPEIAVKSTIVPVKVGGQFNFDLLSTDADNDQVTVTMQGIGFSPATLGMQFGPTSGPDSLLSNFRWTPTCNQAKADTVYNLRFIVKDNSCFKDHSDTVLVTLRIRPELNLKPTLTVQGPTDPITLGSAFNFNVIGLDPDNDQLTASVSGDGFNPAALGVQFGPLTGQGQLNSGFTWTPTCDQLKQDSIFNFVFVVKDNACFKENTDTLRLQLKVNPVPNVKPFITLAAQYTPPVLTIGESYKFPVFSSDADNDQLTVTLTGKDFDPLELGMKFGPLSGKGNLESEFTWTPTCEQATRQTSYDLLFIVKDDNCYKDQGDTLAVRLEIKPLPTDTTIFLPPNVFTPNGDGFNDLFIMPNLPRDNCSESFQEITIYNRWGGKVFESASRQFAWDGKEVSQSTYYYIIRYNNTKYKGYVTILN